MPLSRLLMPFVAKLATSPKLRKFRRGWFEIKRRLMPSLNTVVFYHRVNDPYSYLLLQALPRFLEDFRVNLQIRFVLDLPADGVPQPQLLQRYALEDGKRLAALHELVYPEHPEAPSREDAFHASAILLKHQDRPKLLHLVTEVTGALWGCSTTTFESCLRRYGTLPDRETQSLLDSASADLVSRGHYQSAMLYYGGEWYWGLDRLGHLADRLNKPRLRRTSGDIADYQRQYRHVLQSYSTLRPRPRQVHPLDFYFSFRSPYSYLAADRVFKLAELYKIPVTIKPVMPMVTRGIPLPKAKRGYIVKDAKREAEKYNLPFGKICDPLGDGINHCMALFLYARSIGREKELVVSLASGIWAEGLDVNRLPHLRRMATRAGLDWDAAQARLDDESWRELAQQNREDLDAIGLWGVPAFRYGNLVLWGQDRLWALEKAVLAGSPNGT
ncbi:MAG: 2-hydroxychromene-2-carboxylate isomerase [Gammaproteobacteria bacterium]|nr:2-hydroxychromene-2-carboxylate isomerase [Gammaproteobacteria bacterium]